MPNSTLTPPLFNYCHVLSCVSPFKVVYLLDYTYLSIERAVYKFNQENVCTTMMNCANSFIYDDSTCKKGFSLDLHKSCIFYPIYLPIFFFELVKMVNHLNDSQWKRSYPVFYILLYKVISTNRQTRMCL